MGNAGFEMIGDKIGHRLDPYINFFLHKLFGKRGNPNLFTLTGFFVTLLASFLILKDLWLLAGLAIIRGFSICSMGW